MKRNRKRNIESGVDVSDRRVESDRTPLADEHDNHMVAITSLLILIFVVIAIIGIVQEYRQEKLLQNPTQVELEAAHQLIAVHLASQNDSIDRYTYKVRKDLIHIYNQTRGIEVELVSNVSEYIYIIDLDRMLIVATQQTSLFIDPSKLSPRLCNRLDLDICPHR